ncbi:hypothetical protein M8J77_003299 [Diaphorina citri]|nr:hypothetical protein M8J77_003299 [Diaphorina citri]
MGKRKKNHNMEKAKESKDSGRRKVETKKKESQRGWKIKRVQFQPILMENIPPDKSYRQYPGQQFSTTVFQSTPAQFSR